MEKARWCNCMYLEVHYMHVMATIHFNTSLTQQSTELVETYTVDI